MFSKIYRPLFLITVSFLATILLCQLIKGDCIFSFFKGSNKEEKKEDNRVLTNVDFDKEKETEKKSDNFKPDSLKSWEQNRKEVKPVLKIDNVKTDSLKLIEQGYKSKHIRNGDEPDCYNYNPVYDREIINSLEVEVGGGTDVAIKLMDKRTNKCIRYFFVNSRTTYAINNIPEGVYYLKIAYGKRWMMTNENGQCIGKFLRSPSYEKGDELLDYNIVDLGNRQRIPSFKISLDVIESSAVNSFDTKEITEDQFNQ